MALKRSQKLGRFVILATMTEKDTGTTYIALDPSTADEVVLKTLDEAELTSRSQLPRFRREQEVYRKLDHRNIVRFLDAGQEGHLHYTALERAKGMGLDIIMGETQGPLGLHWSLDIVRQVLEALSYLHKQGILHRDVQPENIFVESGGAVKLLDFGVASADDDLVSTRIGEVLGRYSYASPEQNQGQQVDERSDLYSMGLVFWEMLAGRRAFPVADPGEVLRRQLLEPLPGPADVNRGIPAKVDAAVRRMVQADRSKRFTSADEVLMLLKGF